MKRKIAIILITVFILGTVSVFAAGYKFRNILSATTTVVKTGQGRLAAIVVNKAVLSSVITIYDNTSAAGTKIATITNPATLIHTQMVLPYNVEFRTGLTVVTSSTDDITVIYE